MATFYFNSIVDGNWQTLGNWWMNSIHTIPATGLPTSTDDVIAYPADDPSYSPIITNSGSIPTVANLTIKDSPNHVGEYVYTFSMDITVTMLASFEDTALLVGANINGNAIFIGGTTVLSSTVNGNVIQKGTSLFNGGLVTGTLTSYDSSTVETTVSGVLVTNDYSYFNAGVALSNAIFNGTQNNGFVNGDAIFNNALNDPRYPGTVYGHSIFNNSINYAECVGTAEFNGTSLNDRINSYIFGIPGGICHNDTTFNDSSINQGQIFGNAIFNDSSFAYPSDGIDILYNGSVTFQNRTPYPLKRGVNSSSLLGVV